jgi:hypothetical protein
MNGVIAYLKNMRHGVLLITIENENVYGCDNKFGGQQQLKAI